MRRREINRLQDLKCEGRLSLVNGGILAFLLLSFPGKAWSEELPEKFLTFFDSYCMDCHDPDTAKGDFHIDLLKSVETPGDAEYWQLALDSLHLGEMPPPKKKQPIASELAEITLWIENGLARAAKKLKGHTEEVVLKRLNRTEFEYTIEDLFGVKGDFASAFPEDAKEDGFDNNGAALMLSAEQVQQYFEAADYILERAITTSPKPETKLLSFTLHRFNEENWESQKKQLKRRLEQFDEATPDEQERTREMQKQMKENPHYAYRYPAVIDGKPAAPKPGMGSETDAAIAIKYGPPSTSRIFRVREAGWYRFRVTGYAIQNNGEPCQLKVSYGKFGQGHVPSVAGVIAFRETRPTDHEFKVYLQPNEQIEIKMTTGQNWTRPGTMAGLDTSMIVIRSAEMEGPIIEEWPPRGHRLLLGERTVEDVTDTEIPFIISELAPRLFRRQVKNTTVDEFVDFYQGARSQLQPLDAFKLTAKAMMTSPHFIYHLEPESGPDASALANRLSYFLWHSAPDSRLMELASSGKLKLPEILKGEVERLSHDEKSERFLKNFVGQWLEVNLVGDMQPDSKLYPEYDEDLERGMVAETESFIREMIQEDEPLLDLIDSDWAMLNARMAKHYGIEGVIGNDFRRVSLDKAKTVRGGLLTQASILNVTSNGTTTSPIVRGVFVLDQILGTPASPPPPDVPVIEPDIRGASTIQEQLEKHRSIAQCNNCHQKIDPYGIALENFDVIGGWRESYRALDPSKNPRYPKLVEGKKVSSGDTMPRHGAFADFREFRDKLKKDEALLYHNMAHKLASYALGRSMDFADEPALKQIATETGKKGGGIRTMIFQLVQSELFQRP